MRIFIANRGEIALRIIRAVREIGYEAIVAYSREESNAPYVKAADEAYELSSPRSFIDIREMVEIIERSRADAVHPGYGFLSENPLFAQAVLDIGSTRIGPPPKVLELLGDKVQAKRIAKRAGVPTLPATEEPVRSLGEALRAAERIGYPVVVKAVGGGGGMGIRVAHTPEELEVAWNIAAKEAKQAFGDERVFIEKYLDKPRHIEVQILADSSRVYHLYERDCSVQRKFQKIIEEAPSAILSEEERERVASYAIKMAEAVGFYNAGTVEFLYKDGSFYFLEVNPRLQVEHGVTEAVTGIDIVKEQIRIALRGEVSFKQEDVKIRGHAIEARIYAENPFSGFLPTKGTITRYRIPSGPGIRVDDHAEDGYMIPEYYNALIAKVISWGRDRREAIERLKRALKEFIISGVSTNIPLHLSILEDEEYIENRVYTRYLEERLDKIYERMLSEHLKTLAALAIALSLKPKAERIERSKRGRILSRFFDLRSRRR